MVQFRGLIEADFPQLVQKQAQLREGGFLATYARVLILSSEGQMGVLDGLLATLEQDPVMGRDYGPEGYLFLVAISRLRLQIGLSQVERDAVMAMLETARVRREWFAEGCFVAALAYEVLGEFASCANYYKLAASEFDALGIKRKSLRALHGAIVAESRLDPARFLVSDFQLLYLSAKKQRDEVTAGLALNGIARQYHAIGASLGALKFGDRAIDLLKRDPESLHYCLAVLNRGRILADLGRIKEARADLDRVRFVRIQEVEAGAQVLGLILASKAVQADPVSVLPLNQSLPEPEHVEEPLTPLESRLISHLISGAMSKYDLIQKLYGDRIGFSSAENRFKNVLNRVKKKRPGLIILEDGQYRIYGAKKSA